MEDDGIMVRNLCRTNENELKQKRVHCVRKCGRHCMVKLPVLRTNILLLFVSMCRLIFMCVGVRAAVILAHHWQNSRIIN